MKMAELLPLKVFPHSIKLTGIDQINLHSNQTYVLSDLEYNCQKPSLWIKIIQEKK